MVRFKIFFFSESKKLDVLQNQTQKINKNCSQKKMKYSSAINGIRSAIPWWNNFQKKIEIESKVIKGNLDPKKAPNFISKTIPKSRFTFGPFSILIERHKYNLNSKYNKSIYVKPIHADLLAQKNLKIYSSTDWALFWKRN